MADPNVLGIVLAGGEGKRLSPLTLDRAKPAVPFGGLYRLIDFALSNLVNGGVLRIAVLTQYKSHSLDRHITTTWRMSSLLANYVTPVPAQQRLGPQWYTGSADAIYQSLNLIHDEKPDLVIVFGADHVYRMDPRQMIAQHLDSGAGATVAGIPVPRKEASAFGVIKTASDGQQARRSWRSHPTRRGYQVAPMRRSCRWATTCSPPTCWSRHCARTPPTSPAARHGRQHHADDGGPGHGTGLRLSAQRGARCRPRGRRLLAGRWNVGLLLRRAHGPVRCRPVFNLTTASGRFSPTSRRTHRRSSCTRTASGSAMRSTAWLPTASSSLGAGARVGAVPRRADRGLRHRGTLSDHGQHGHRR